MALLLQRRGIEKYIERYAQFNADNLTNDRKVFVFDPTDLADYVIPIGKQTRNPEHIFYRPCSGIWQTVWLESAPAERISQLDVKAAADGSMTVNVHSSSNSTGKPVEIEVLSEDGSVMAKGSGTTGQKFTFDVPGVQPWSPDAPTLYNLTVTMGQDKVSSYTGFRTVEKGEVDGIPRPMLNGEFVFQFATLDQGFWPDGIYTPPSYEAMVFDLKELKKLGFNTVRKHVSPRGRPGDLQNEGRRKSRLLTMVILIRRSKSSPICSTGRVTASVSW